MPANSSSSATVSSAAPSHPLMLSVVVPVRNEAGNIGLLLAEIHRALRPVVHESYEIIYVNDGSADGTAAELATAAKADPMLRVFSHRRSCGQSQATITGVLAARGTWIATLDGDGQNDPADIVSLLAARDGTGDESLALFIGRRRMRYDSLMRVVASRIANMIRRSLLRDGTADSGSGLKLLTRELFLSLPRFDALHRFMPALVRRAGGRVVSVPIGHRPRLHGKSKYGIVGRGLIGIADLWGVFWLIRRYTRPDVSENADRM
ncbi:MAG: glycosyltransferase [Rhodospirillaceae bacterium]|nr:MAG: glycosyltransferase [Rhodospirillaceae bacterium]